MGTFSNFDPVQPTILTVPGLGGSGPSHWQSLWEQARPDTIRVELGMWNTPHRNAWVTKLDQAIRSAQAPVVLAARSLPVGWGSHFVDAGAQGHLNAASGIGWWAEGQELLDRVIGAAADRHGKPLSPGDARSILAINATDAAQSYYLAR